MLNNVTGKSTQPLSSQTGRTTVSAPPASQGAPANAPRSQAVGDVSSISSSAVSGSRPAYSGQALFQTGKSDPRGGTQDLDKMLNQFSADFKMMSPEQQKTLLADPGFRIDVTGYASNAGTKSSYDNQGLSARRATETAAHVKAFLAKQGIDVPASAIKSKGAGTPSNPGKPLDNNDQTDRSAKVEIFMPKVVAGGKPPAQQQNQPAAPSSPAPASGGSAPAQNSGETQGSGQAQGNGKAQGNGGKGTGIQDVANGLTALAELAKAFGDLWNTVRKKPTQAEPGPVVNQPAPQSPAPAPVFPAPVIVTTKKEEEEEKKPAPAPAPVPSPVPAPEPGPAPAPPAPVVADDGFKGVEGPKAQIVEVPYGGVAAGS
ncbi:MAG: hypothetical protein VKO64_11555 [Candidatus Sericytochromatia bacterium]|nr:hypothetical protein [Candidatus Sericytochromatia bacterium]